MGGFGGDLVDLGKVNFCPDFCNLKLSIFDPQHQVFYFDLWHGQVLGMLSIRP